MARLPSIADLMTIIKQLQRDVKRLQRATPLRSSSISGGGLTIQDLGRLLISMGGSFLANDEDGDEVFYVGGYQDAGYGVSITRPGGWPALSVIEPTQDAPGDLSLTDKNGRPLLLEDAAGGLAYPHLLMNVSSHDYLTWPGTDQGAYAPVVGVAAFTPSPKFLLGIRHTTDEVATTGNLRVVTGATVHVTDTVGYGIATEYYGPFDAPGEPGEYLDITVECQRTAGVGRVRAEVFLAVGYPS